jgi:hypothetical protein
VIDRPPRIPAELDMQPRGPRSGVRTAGIGPHPAAVRIRGQLEQRPGGREFMRAGCLPERQPRLMTAVLKSLRSGGRQAVPWRSSYPQWCSQRHPRVEGAQLAAIAMPASLRFGRGRSCRGRLPGQISPWVSPWRTAAVLVLASSLR